jgi:hypothetical protein
MHPRPIIYNFGHTGLAGYEWVKDFDRKWGKYAAVNESEFTRCETLQFNDNHELAQPVKTMWGGVDLSINGQTLAAILIKFAYTRISPAFETPRDLALFFDKYTNAINSAERWLNDAGDKRRLIQAAMDKQ